MDRRSDAELMEAVRAGGREEFEELYRRHAARVFAYLWRMVRDDAVAADLRQEAFFRLWLARAEWRGGDSVAAYLLRTARNLAINRQRHLRVRERAADTERLAPRPVAPASDELLSQQELRERINAAVDALPERIRQVFSLKRDASLSYREIAQLLDISPKTVEAHMAKALKLLRALLADLRDPDTRC